EGLRDVTTLHDLAGQLVIDAERLHHFDTCGPVGGRGRIGDRDLVEVRVPQGLFALYQIGTRAEENELADRIAQQRVGDAEAIVHQLLWGVLIGGQEYLERRRLRYLGVELTGRAEAQDGLVAGLAF